MTHRGGHQHDFLETCFPIPTTEKHGNRMSYCQRVASSGEPTICGVSALRGRRLFC